MPRRTASLAAALAAGLAAAPPVAADPASGPLDGLTFVSTIEVDAYDTPFDDRQTFADGTFLSEECQRRCDFGAAPYYTRREGDAVAFVVEMTCADAPQHVRWEGRVVGDRIEGTAVWTVERFYWTVVRTATFSGVLVPEEQAAAVE
jgi:hypothetical protein